VWNVIEAFGEIQADDNHAVNIVQATNQANAYVCHQCYTYRLFVLLGLKVARDFREF